MQLKIETVAYEEALNMDLRIQKTLETIRLQFLELRKACPLNKIKVSVICQQSQINKTTFYRHYTDVYDLSNRLENAVIAKLIDDFEYIGCLFTDPERFIVSMLGAVAKYDNEINALFSERIEVFTAKFETIMKDFYLKESASVEDDVKLSFIIGGAAHVFLDSRFDYKTVTKVLAALLGKIQPAGSNM